MVCLSLSLQAYRSFRCLKTVSGRPSAEIIEHAGSTQTSEIEGPTTEEGQKQYQFKNPCRIYGVERGFMVETDES